MLMKVVILIEKLKKGLKVSYTRLGFYITWLNLFLSAGLTIAFLLMIVVVPVIALRDKKSDYPYPESMQKGYYKKFYD